MLILLFVLFLALAIWGFLSYDDVYDNSDFSLRFIFGLMACIVIVITYILTLLYYPWNIDKKITMYEEENYKIEEKVKNTVRVYMEYEKDTYNDLFEDCDLTTLLVAYPELNSNQLVKSEINLYIENNNKIKKLKEDKINRSIYRFWLYFGK